ncbi:MAG: hypothetical protein EA380_06965 [Phycisphaeraceae bacterium]|nr:MAG: hypothetical protein EA380_06965 [Phycisphaeraceae bacterium]
MLPTEDTIVAVASPAGRAARGIVRVDGAATPAILRALTGEVPDERGVRRARLRLRGWEAHDLSMACLVLRARAGRSYTGGESAELILPGNPHLLRRIVDDALSVSTPERIVRGALPGEFTARAMLAGRMTSEQAEGVQALVSAGNAHEHALARSLLDGSTGDRYRAVADELAVLLALVESGIDFTDEEDVVPIAPAELCARLGKLDVEMVSLLGPGSRATVDESPVRMALVGAPNAGKSTLFNALLGRERAIVSEQAGTTRDVIAEALPRDPMMPHAPAIELLDLAGLDAGSASDGRAHGAAQLAARDAIGAADAIVWCDPSGQFDDAKVAHLVAERPAMVLRVRTKADLVAPQDTGEMLAVCALDGWRMDALHRALCDAATTVRGYSTPLAPGSLVSRHRAALQEAQRCVREAMELINPAREAHSIELVASSLRLALDRIGEIAGRIEPDDIIGRIFATFCIGK